MPPEEARARLRHIYNDYRTALLSRKYYAHRLDAFKKLNYGFELAITIGTSASVGAWMIWKTGWGASAWAVISASAALASIIKTALQLSKEVERYSKLYSGYSCLYYDMKDVVTRIQETKTLDAEILRAIEGARKTVRELIPTEDPKPQEALRRMYFNEVNIEIPAKNLWMP